MQIRVKTPLNFIDQFIILKLFLSNDLFIKESQNCSLYFVQFTNYTNANLQHA